MEDDVQTYISHFSGCNKMKDEKAERMVLETSEEEEASKDDKAETAEQLLLGKNEVDKNSIFHLLQNMKTSNLVISIRQPVI